MIVRIDDKKQRHDCLIKSDYPQCFSHFSLLLSQMATRSRIGLLLETGYVLSVYHHWDGYPEWLGVTLREKFNTYEKIAELIDGGDVSCIDSDSDWQLNKVDNHVQYYNDRGENTEPRLDQTVEDYLANGEEFAYLFENNQWVCYKLPYQGDPYVVNIPDKEVVNVS